MKKKNTMIKYSQRSETLQGIRILKQLNQKMFLKIIKY